MLVMTDETSGVVGSKVGLLAGSPQRPMGHYCACGSRGSPAKHNDLHSARRQAPQNVRQEFLYSSYTRRVLALWACLLYGSRR